jgi:hypothetical protein
MIVIVLWTVYRNHLVMMTMAVLLMMMVLTLTTIAFDAHEQE